MEKKRSRLIRWSKKFVLHMAQFHIVQTGATGQTLREIYGLPHEQLMYAPFDGGGTFFKYLLKLASPGDNDSIRDQYSTPHNAVVFLYVGTLIYLKGVDILIEAFARLQSSYTHAYLWIVGPDGRSSGQLAFLQSHVRKLSLSNRVIFTGQKSIKELIALYRASDVFVLPSRKDVWPKVLVEAALTGLPLITTSATGSAYSLVRDGINGFVVPPDDADCLSRAMLFLTDSKARTQMGKNTRKIVEEFVQPEMETDNIAEGILRMLKVR
jgi:glycosyltransferase involved in cell wall biosynthesis